jgi:hypothetical protein
MLIGEAGRPDESTSACDREREGLGSRRAVAAWFLGVGKEGKRRGTGESEGGTGRLRPL